MYFFDFSTVWRTKVQVGDYVLDCIAKHKSKKKKTPQKTITRKDKIIAMKFTSFTAIAAAMLVAPSAAKIGERELGPHCPGNKHPHKWCRSISPHSRAKHDIECYSNFKTDCHCEHGFYMSGYTCKNSGYGGCNNDDPAAWCLTYSEHAVPKADVKCYSFFQKDCACSEGYKMWGQSCK